MSHGEHIVKDILRVVYLPRAKLGALYSDVARENGIAR